MKKTLTIAVLLIGTFSLAQVGINTDTPDANSDLTLASEDKGLLLNRVELEETTDPAPLTAHVEGMVVYNTATAGDVAPGQYYNDGTQWVRLGSSAAPTNDWHITGNAGTVAGTNFLGTTDNTDMVFKRNNVVAGALKDNNTSFGVGSRPTTALGSGNAAFGNNALGSTTAVSPGASLNTAVGTNALSKLNTGTGNVAVGWSALEANESGFQNVAIGTNAMRRGTGSASSTAVGYNALLNDQAGQYNTAIGTSSLANASLSTSAIAGNTGVGVSSLSGVSTGTFNTGIGYLSGSNITTGSNNTTLGYNAVVPTSSASNQVRIGNTAVTYAGVQVAWTVTSDKRLKNDIQDSNLGLDFIKQLRPVSYIRKNDESKKSEYGFIAQELKETLKNNGVTNSGIISEADDSTMSVRYNDLLAPMVKAIQEQQKLIEALQKRIEELENK
jgi:hypothetical protein